MADLAFFFSKTTRQAGWKWENTWVTNVISNYGAEIQ